jgi:hypothetical protein
LKRVLNSRNVKSEKPDNWEWAWDFIIDDKVLGFGFWKFTIFLTVIFLKPHSH